MALEHFVAERDWDQFHSPKNLACSLCIEAGELLEQFQWMADTASSAILQPKRDQIAEELADIFLYLIRLSGKMEIDLISAARQKLVRNAEKYPINKARGS